METIGPDDAIAHPTTASWGGGVGGSGSRNMKRCREIPRKALAEKAGVGSFKEALLAMPDVGEDADFARTPFSAPETRRRRKEGIEIVGTS